MAEPTREEKTAFIHYGIKTLKPRMNDSLDFHDLHVDQLRQALEYAFKQGQQGRDMTRRQVMVTTHHNEDVDEVVDTLIDASKENDALKGITYTRGFKE